MTKLMEIHRSRRSLRGLSAGQLCFGWFSLFCLLMILRNSEIAMEYIHRGLRLCGGTVIPSLFPFMVISELILSSGIGEWLLRPISPPLEKLLRLPRAGCCAVVLGMLCGFPVGAKCAVSAMDQGLLKREEAERVLLFSTNPSSAFLINAVGVSLLESRRLGVLLYVTVLLSQLAVGLLFTHLSRRKTKKPAQKSVAFHEKSSTSNASRSHETQPKKLPAGAKLFTDAIRSSTHGILLVCAYVIFFSALMGTLNLMLEQLGANTEWKAAIGCLFELSCGVSTASAIPNRRLSVPLCAFAAGWSGISVHCQLLSVCDGHGLRFHSYLLAKLLQGLLCAAVMLTPFILQ